MKLRLTRNFLQARESFSLRPTFVIKRRSRILLFGGIKKKKNPKYGEREREREEEKIVSARWFSEFLSG